MGSILDHALQREVGTASWASIWATSGKPLNLSGLQCPFLKNRDAKRCPAYHTALLGGPRRGWQTTAGDSLPHLLFCIFKILHHVHYILKI